MKFADRLKVTAQNLSAQTLAVGAVITMGAAYANCRTLAQAISDDSTNPLGLKVGDLNVPFNIDDGSNWQDCLCDITDSTHITVRQILNGSNGLNPATFNTTTPTVYNCVPGNWLTRVPVDTFPASFSTTVPLNQIGTAHMPRQTINGNLTFTAGVNAVRGAYAEYPIVADGTSTLTMSGFTEHGSSAGILNSAGMPNTIMFWYDGYNYWWSASQAANPVAIDNVPPTMASAAVVNATPATVTLTASEALDSAFIPAASAFTIPGHTVLAVTSVNGTAVTLSVSPAFINGEDTSVTYNQPGSNGLRDLAGNQMLGFTIAHISNTVNPNATALTLTAGASSGTVNAASLPFTVALSPTGSNYSGTDTVTPNDGGAGGTFSPTSVQLTQAAPSATFTYTPSTTGARTISVTNSGSATTLTNPAGVSYTSNAASGEQLFINTIASPQKVGTPFTVSGTWTGTKPGSLEFHLSDDAAGVWTAASATINAGGTWSFSQNPLSVNASRTITVRDAGATTITATSNSYTVNADVPAAPTNVAASAGDTTAQVTFTPGAANGSAITGFTATATPGGATVSGAASPLNFSGLTDGTTYTFTVHATNGVGNSVESAASNGVIPAAPANYPRLAAPLTNATESGTGPYTYTGTGQALNTSVNGGVSTKSIPANADGSIDFTVVTSGSIIIGFRGTQVQAGQYQDILYGIFMNGTAAYSMKSGVNSNLGVAVSPGDILRVLRIGSSGTLKIQIARAATPTSFTDMATSASTYTGQIWAQVNVYTTSAAQLVAGAGFV